MRATRLSIDLSPSSPRSWIRLFRDPLGNKIAVALVLKLVALFAMYQVFFGPDQRPEVTPSVVEQHLLGSEAQ